MRIIRGESCSISVKGTRLPANPENEAAHDAILFPILRPNNVLQTVPKYMDKISLMARPLIHRGFSFPVAMQQVVGAYSRAYIETIHFRQNVNMESAEQEKGKQNQSKTRDQDNMATESEFRYCSALNFIF